MGKSDTALQINPAVLKWAITESGWDSKELSEAVGIGHEDIEMWQTQSTSIKLSKLRRISKKIKRPLTVLMLPEPPDEPHMLDYRRVGGVKVNISKKTRKVIRNARYVQSIARDILELRGEKMQPDVKFRSKEEDPEVVAEAERIRLGVSLEKGTKKGKMYEFIRDKYIDLKKSVELRNIHVMQGSMNIDEIRGFTLGIRDPKIILINSKDEGRPRIFTLLHEYAHLLLKSNGICSPNLSGLQQISENADVLVEKWCNDFAGAYIMPKNKILDFVNNKKNEEPQKVVNSLTRKFSASKMAIAIRICNLLGAGPHRDKYKTYYDTITSNPTITHSGGGGGGGRDLVRECINRNGLRYVRLVFDSENKGLITTNEMLKYLSLKTKHIEKLGAYM